MAVNTNFQIPFLPQTGVTEQILTAIQAANEQHRFQQQLAIQQQQANIAQQRATTEAQLAPSQIEHNAALAGLLGEEKRQKALQSQQLEENMRFFSQPAQPQGQRGTPAAGGAWLPSNTPQGFAPIMAGMLPDNLDANEQKIMEAASQAGAAKATTLGGTKADYLNSIREGVKEVVNARNALVKPEGQRQLNADQAQTVNQGRLQINPNLSPALLAKAGDTQEQTDRIDRLIQQASTAQATKAQRDTANAIAQGNQDMRRMVVGMQQAKFNEEPVIAYDRQKQELVQSSRGEVANSNGLLTNPSDKLTEAQATKHRDTLGQLNEAQLNLSRAQQAYNQIPGGELSLADKRAVAAIEGDDKFHAEFGFGKQGVQLPVDWANRLLNNENFKSLSPAAKAAVIGDLRMQGPMVLAYTKALTNTGRMNEVALRAEGKTVPNAGMDEATRNQLILSFQQNIDQLAKSTPRMVGMDKPQDVKGRIDSEPVTPLPAGRAGASVPQVGTGGTLQELQRRLFGGGGTPVPQATPPAEQSFGDTLRQLMGNQ